MKVLRYYMPAIIWVIIVLVLCTLPGKDIPHSPLFEKVHMDKIVHFTLFAGSVLFISLGYYWHKKRVSELTFLTIVLVASFYGLAIEFIQKYFTSSRSFDMNDVAADVLGAVAGIWIFKLVKRLFIDK